MRVRKTIDWVDPVAMARGIACDMHSWVLLYSGDRCSFSGRYSILAMCSENELKCSSFDVLADELKVGNNKFDNAWFGYLGYGLKNSCEKLQEDEVYEFDWPDLWMVRYRLILLFDHEECIVQVWSESEDDLQFMPVSSECVECNVQMQGLHSNMGNDAYLQKVRDIKEAIIRGDLYQANLTRKYNGKIANNINKVDLFYKLSCVSPSSYSALFKFGDKYVISSSPERFLRVDDEGNVDVRPIKGSAMRYDDERLDIQSCEFLRSSEKDMAENLMIVDLLRNDLSRGCEIGSVRVEKLFEILSYATIHHMSSTVIGSKRDDVSLVDLVRGCFPPGSMTGAPKIQAMEMCSQLEKVKRGVYSGAVGWFGGDGSADLSVVIRTILLDGDKFEFQVGGAIVADSDPHNELQEILVKAKGICLALGIDVADLR